MTIITFLAMNALAFSAAWRLGKAGARGWLEAAIGTGVFFFALIVTLTAVLGFVGAAGKWPFATGAAVVWAVVLFAVKPVSVKFPSIPIKVLPVSIMCAISILAIAGIFVWDVVTPPPAGGDPFIYNLTFPATWLKAGRIEYVALPYGAQAATYYPLNMELFNMWLLAGAGGDMAANLAQLPTLLLCGLGVAGIARAAGVAKPGALIGAASAMLSPGLVQQATVARVDVAFAAWFVTAIYFAYIWGSSRSNRHLALFGVSLGLLIGTKSLGAVYAIIPGALFISQLKGGASRIFSDLVRVSILAVVFGGFWHLRNWLATGNPFFPLNVSLFGINIFPGAYEGSAMRAFHTSDTAELAKIGGLFIGFWLQQYLLLGAVVAGFAVLLKNRLSRKKLAYLLLTPWATLALFWFVNPHNNLTNGRFIFPAVLMLGFCVAVAINDAKGIVGKAMAWLAPAAVVATSFIKDCDHLPRLLRDVGSAAVGIGGGLLIPASVAIALLLGAVAAAALALIMRRKRFIAFASCFAALVLLVSAMTAALDCHKEHKYDWHVFFPEGRAWAQLEQMTKGRSLRIASAGGERAYGLFGADMRHNVMTVNIDEHLDWQFHDYWKQARIDGKADPKTAGERPQWHREAGAPSLWLNNLQEKKIDIVFASVLDPISRSFMEHDDAGFPVEVAWADSMPDDFRMLFANSVSRIYAVRPAPDIADN
ncbi:MAG TPA: hypothetical protein PKH33_02520 [bacterium]|nr:hypothetical protein [bacterium]